MAGFRLQQQSLATKFGYIFDPDYFIYAEDVDLGLRLRLVGYKVVFVPKAIIYHMHAMTTKKLGSHTTFLLEKNLLTTFFKIFSIKNIILLLPYVIFVRIVALTRDVITFKFSSAFSRLKAFFWVISNFKLIWQKRKELQKLKVLDDSFILKVFSERHFLQHERRQSVL